MSLDIKFICSAADFKGCPSFGLPEVCISGRSNVGKSSLINRFANRKKLAKVSQTPGKTRTLNFFQVSDKFMLVDLPGYGYAKISKTERNSFLGMVGNYLESRKELKGIIQLIDSRHGPVSGDKIMIEWLINWKGEKLFVLTKADKLSNMEKAATLKKYKKEFATENIILFSSETGQGLRELNFWLENLVKNTSQL